MYDNYPGDFATGFFDNQAASKTGEQAEALAPVCAKPPSANDFVSEILDDEQTGGVTDTDYTDGFAVAPDPAIYDISVPAKMY